MRRLYRPRFVAAGDLLDGARSILSPTIDLGLDPLRRRLLFTGSPVGVDAATEAIEYLDVPPPSAAVEITICETARRCRRENGGHGIFDRGGPPAGPDTFFRGVRYDFEPESWLRSELLGTDPFEGTSIRGGQSGTGGPFAGAVDVVLRTLSHDGEAEILANPTIVVTEGVPAVVNSRLLLPASLFAREGGAVLGDKIVTNTLATEEAGVRVEVTAEWIGADHLVLRLHPWVRQLTAARSAEGPEGYPVLAVRELTTVVTVADGEEVLLGGVAGWARVNDTKGLPVPPALAALASAIGSRLEDVASVDLVFRVRARILHPGRDGASSVPPCEDERLRLGRIAGAIPRRR